MLESPERTLLAVIRAGRLDDLRWPDFSDYRSDVQNFYSRSGYATAWVRDGQPTSQALQMITILQHADERGLRAEDYDSSHWNGRVTHLQGPRSASDEARFDAALTICAMRYVSDLLVGRINPQYFKSRIDAGPKELDLAKFVQEHLANGADLKSEVAALEPPFVGYRELQKALLTYMRLAKEDAGEKLPMPTDIGYPGPPYPGFVRLIGLLRRLGDFPDNYPESAASSQSDDLLSLQAVRHFQERHGLPATGYLDAATIEQLNVPLSYRVEQIRLALERYRWARYDFPQSPIVVNIPGFRLYALDREGKIALTMRVDVGDDFDNTRTPVMEHFIEYLVFRPYWEVPLGIQREEIAASLLEDSAYLSKYNFEVLSPTGQIVSTGQVTKRVWQQIRAGSLHVRQRPGPENTLGLVKFIFPNRHSVYLHDSAARDFYASPPNRVVSHGCVHVEKPAELAAWVLRDKPEWNLERVRQAMTGGQNNLRVNLSKPLPVLFVYATTSVRENGDIHFYPDVYGYDAELLQALARGYPYPKLQSRNNRNEKR